MATSSCQPATGPAPGPDGRGGTRARSSRPSTPGQQFARTPCASQGRGGPPGATTSTPPIPGCCTASRSADASPAVGSPASADRSVIETQPQAVSERHVVLRTHERWRSELADAISSRGGALVICEATQARSASGRHDGVPAGALAIVGVRTIMLGAPERPSDRVGRRFLQSPPLRTNRDRAADGMKQPEGQGADGAGALAPAPANEQRFPQANRSIAP